MIEFKIGYIGKEDDEVYKRAEEYFKEKNLNDDDFHIVIENITGMSAEEIEAKTFHTVLFDAKFFEPKEENSNEKNSDDEKINNTFKALKNSGINMADVNFLPYVRKEMTKTKVGKYNNKFQEELETNEAEIIPINVSAEKDIEGYLDSIYISSIEYRESVKGIMLDRDAIRDVIVNQVLEALRRKDEKAGYDYVTYDHVVSVGKMTEAFAKFLEYDEETVKSMKYSAMIHDTGKIAMPVDVLYTGLSLGNEVEQMNPHDELGGIIINNPKIISESEKEGMVGHHGKVNTDNDYSNIITMIDSFDAMTSQRGYNNPKNIFEALQEVMRCSGTQFRDKEMCKQFILYNMVELGKMGYDVKAMFESILDEKQAKYESAQKSNSDSWKSSAKAGLTVVEAILDIYEQNKEQIVIENPPTKEVSDLGYTIDEYGRLDYTEKILKPNYGIRVNSEFEFQVRNLLKNEKMQEEILGQNKEGRLEELRKAKNINELVNIFLNQQGVSKEETHFWKLASEKIDISNKEGRKLLEIGRQTREKQEQEPETNIQKKNLADEIPDAAKNDKGFNEKNTYDSTRTVVDSLKQDKDKDQQGQDYK